MHLSKSAILKDFDKLNLPLCGPRGQATGIRWNWLKSSLKDFDKLNLPLCGPRGQATGIRWNWLKSSYSDFEIYTYHEIRLVYRLPLRQTQGFIDSLFRQMGIVLACPDYTVLSKRLAELGWMQWQKAREYGRRNYSELGVQRYQRTFGDAMHARDFPRQQQEAMSVSGALNKMTFLGMPQSHRSA